MAIHGSRLTSSRLKGHLRSLILSKHARPNVDVDALIEKRHKDAKLKIFRKPSSKSPEARKKTTKAKQTDTKTYERVRGKRQVTLTDESSELSGVASSDSDDSVVDHSARKCRQSRSTQGSFKVALRLYRQASPEEVPSIGFCFSYDTTFIDDKLKSSVELFDYISQHTEEECRYLEFHPPEDMSLEGRIRIDRDSGIADDTFQRVMTMLRKARSFGGEPSYRTIEVEVGVRGRND